MNAFSRGIGVLLVVCAAILAICGIVNDSTPPEPEPEPTYTLTLNCTNAATMHSWGLPTKADVMQYHVHGQWGFFQDGTLIAFDDLPGQNDNWDRLYGIDSENPAFDK